MKAFDKGLILDKRCDVTAFDLHLQLHHDGGGNQPPGDGRGVWFFLSDDSKERRAAYETWFKALTDRLHEEHPTVGFAASLSLTEVRSLLKADVREGVLMPWRDVEAIHKALGDVLEAHKQILANRKET